MMNRLWYWRCMISTSSETAWHCIVICNVMPITCMDDYMEGYFAWRCLHVVVEQVKRRAFYTNSSQGVPRWRKLSLWPRFVFVVCLNGEVIRYIHFLASSESRSFRSWWAFYGYSTLNSYMGDIILNKRIKTFIGDFHGGCCCQQTLPIYVAPSNLP